MSKFAEKLISQELLAERLLPQQLPHIFSLYPRLGQNISILGPLKYAQEMKRKYQENSHKFQGSFPLLLALCLLIAAAMNSRAPYAALAGFSDSWRWILAILVSVPLTYFAEWAIAHDVMIANCQRDIRKDQQQIDAKKARAQKTNNELIADRADAEQEVFNAVVKDYLHQKSKGLVALAVTLLVIEYGATLFFIRFQGEDGDWITYIVPLLGIFLTVVTGLYKGKMVDYPQEKRKISRKFEDYAQQRQQENPEAIKYATQKFWILEGLTRFLLDNPQATVKQREDKENQLWCEQLRYQRHSVLKEWQSAVQAKKRELNQTPTGIIPPGERSRQIEEEIRLLNEFYGLELHRLQEELARRGDTTTELLNGQSSNGAKFPKIGGAFNPRLIEGGRD